MVDLIEEEARLSLDLLEILPKVWSDRSFIVDEMTFLTPLSMAVAAIVLNPPTVDLRLLLLRFVGEDMGEREETSEVVSVEISVFRNIEVPSSATFSMFLFAVATRR